jgi:hypothetical protein
MYCVTLSDEPPMKETMYSKLVNLIHKHRTWVTILDSKRECMLMARSGTELRPVRRRVLSLVATKPRGVYERGHVWDITEDRLDRAIRSMRRDHKFVERWKRDILLVEDAERIIRHASNGFLNLELEEKPDSLIRGRRPLFCTSKHSRQSK